MRKTIIFLLIITPLIANSQNSYIGVKGGFNLGNIIETGELNDNSFKLGYTSGISYSYLLNDYLSISTDLLFLQRGFYNNNFICVYYHGLVVEKKQFSQTNDYFSLPIKFGYYTDNIFVNMGIIPSYFLNSVVEMPSFDDIMDMEYDLFIPDYDPTINEFKNIDLAGLFEIGSAFKLSERSLIFTSFIYHHSFTNAAQNHFSKSEIIHYGLLWSIGLKYSL